MGLWSNNCTAGMPEEDEVSRTSSSATGDRNAKRAPKSTNAKEGGDETPSTKKRGKQRLVVKVPSSSSDQSRGSLSLDSPLQHFLDARMIMRPNSVFRVNCEDLASSVLSELHEKRIGACVVEFEDRLEFLDCSDFNSFLVSSLAECDESWPATKALLQKLAELPVRSFLKSPRTPSLVFEPFNSSQPLRELVERLQRHRRIPCFSDGELRVVVTANDILELCGGSVAKATKDILESTTFRDILSKDIEESELNVMEDATVLELMQKLSGSTDRAVPVLALPDNTPSAAKPDVQIIAQFDLAALWAIFGNNGSGQWWWENEEVTSNIFLQSCVDFLAKNHATSDGRVQAPVAKVSLDEKLSKVIGRACTSPFRHVVAYEASDDKELRNPCCDVSSHEFVFSLWTKNILSKLEFDSCKPRPSRFRRYFSSHGNAFEAPKAPLSPPAQESGSVQFNNLVEVEALVVPVCPEHHSRFIQLKELLADFQHLKELTQDPVVSAVPCTATCRSCAKILGEVQRRQPVVSHYKSAIKKAPGRSCLRALLGRGAKAVTAGGLRLPGVKPRQTPEPAKAPSRSFSSLFSFCCTCSPATDRLVV